MTDSDRLARIEHQLDTVAQDIVTIKVTLAEWRGTRRAMYAVASILGAIAGLASRLIWHARTPLVLLALLGGHILQ